MRVKLFQEPTVSEAMARVRAELGPEALILSTRRIAGGVELTAAVEQSDAVSGQPSPHAPERQPAQLGGAQPGAAPSSSWSGGGERGRTGAMPEAEEARGGAAQLGGNAQPEPTSLSFHNVPAGLAARLAGPDLAMALRAALRFGVLPIARDGPPLMLTGMPGAGKTLSVARIATRLVLAGIPPLVITTDGRRAGAAEELAAYTRLLGAGLIVAATPGTLRRALAQRRPGSPVLIDTPGLDPFDASDAALLRDFAQAAEAAQLLVMQAGLDCAEAEDQAVAFAGLGAGHLLATRLDLARRLGSVVAAAAAADLIMTEAGIGTSATDGLAPITPEYLAERMRARAPAAAPAAQPGAEPAMPAEAGRAASGARGHPAPAARTDVQPWTPRRLSQAERDRLISPAATS